MFASNNIDHIVSMDERGQWGKLYAAVLQNHCTCRYTEYYVCYLLVHRHLHYIITTRFAVFFYIASYSFLLTYILVRFIWKKNFLDARALYLPICLFRTFCRRETREIDDDLFRSNSMSMFYTVLPTTTFVFSVKNTDQSIYHNTSRFH